MTTLTTIILAPDAKSAKKAKSSASFSDEIIVLEHENIDDYSAVRNAGLKQAKSEWILFLDADETIPPALTREIKQAITSTKFSGFYLRRADTFLGRTLRFGENGRARILRLARKGSGKFHHPVHEVWCVEGRVGTLRTPLLHVPHPTISSFLAKINHYSTLAAAHRHSENVQPTLLHIIFYPPLKFLKNYFLYLGILDGVPGLIMAVMMSFHSFQTWVKLYLLQNQK